MVIAYTMDFSGETVERASFNINKMQLFGKCRWSAFERCAGWGCMGAATLWSHMQLWSTAKQGTWGTRLCQWEMSNPRPFSLPSHKLFGKVSLATTWGSVLEGPPHMPGSGRATRFCSSSWGLLPVKASWPTREGGLGVHRAELYCKGNPHSH